MSKLPVVKSKYTYKKVGNDNPGEGSNFAAAAYKWASQDAVTNYDLLQQPFQEQATVFVPLPMFDAQDPGHFADIRDADEPAYFGQWQLPVHIVRRAGSSFMTAVSFCPYPTFMAEANQDQSPYAVLRNNLRRWMKDNQPDYVKNDNAEDPNPWLRLFNRWQDSASDNSIKSSPIFPQHDVMRLVVCVMLAATESVYDNEAKARSNEYVKYYDPKNGLFGKGIDDGKLTLLAISGQVWADLASKLNATTSEESFAYANPVNPLKPTVWYMWKLGSPVPFQGAIAGTSNFGSTGCVDVKYRTRQNAAGVEVKFPQPFMTPKGTPTDYYYSKVPTHLCDCVQLQQPREQALMLAQAYPNAKRLFEIGWKNTDFTGYLDDPEFNARFAGIEQLWEPEGEMYPATVTLPKKTKASKAADTADYKTDDDPFGGDPPTATPAKPAKPSKSAASKYSAPLPNEPDADLEELEELQPLEEVNDFEQALNDENVEEDEIELDEDADGFVMLDGEYYLDDNGQKQKINEAGELYTPEPLKKKAVRKVKRSA
jgi:hypothetical protein